VNGVFVAEDEHNGTDWMNVQEYNILDFLKIGRNVIAIVATDVNNTRQGLIAGLTYEFVPDMTKQLASLKDRETERDRTMKDEADAKLKAADDAIVAGFLAPPPEQPAVEAAIEAPVEAVAAPAVEVPSGPTPMQLREMRIIEKNKLR